MAVLQNHIPQIISHKRHVVEKEYPVPFPSPVLTAIFNLTFAPHCAIFSQALPTPFLGGDTPMVKLDAGAPVLSGPNGSLPVQKDDEITLKLAMLFEGQCEGLGPLRAAEKFGFTRQRYHQILKEYLAHGAAGLKNLKTGPKGNYRRSEEVIRQVIRYRFLDPKMSSEVIAQKLNQNGYLLAIRSVERVISEYGLQKKTPPLSSRKRARHG